MPLPSAVKPSGAEYLNIANSLAGGHGFSVLEANRWMWYDFVIPTEQLSQTTYYPTTMAEPIYPWLMSLAFQVFGESGKLVIVFAHIAAWFASAYAWFCIGSRYHSKWLGAVCAVLLLSWPSAKGIHIQFLSPAPFAAFYVSIIVLLCLQLLEQYSLRKSILLGIVLGFASLTLATIMALIPLGLPLLSYYRDYKARDSWLSAVSIALVAVLVISPWTYRNYQLSGEIIPVRVGMGLNTHQGNPILAATYFPNQYACSETSGSSLWQSSGPRETIRDMGKSANARAIYRLGYACISENAPDNYAQLNEFQRDALLCRYGTEFYVRTPESIYRTGDPQIHQNSSKAGNARIPLLVHWHWSA